MPVSRPGAGANAAAPTPSRRAIPATGKRDRFYVGSIPSGDIHGGSLRTGDGEIVVDAPEGGRVLIMVKSSTGELFTVDPDTGASVEIPYNGEVDEATACCCRAASSTSPRTRTTGVTVVRLRRNLSAGRIVQQIASGRFEVPTTIARSFGRFYVVNAKLMRPNPDMSYEVVKVPKR